MTGSILLISDVHADAGALGQILDIAFSEGFSRRYGPVERVLNMGDVMERGYQPKEAVDRLKKLKNLQSILGNHDEAFLHNRSLSGSDLASVTAHEQYRESGEHLEFFKGMGTRYVDEDAKLYAVHGGPIDPGALAKGTHMADAWLLSRTWQRISDTGYRYLDTSGYHYLPEDAFDAVGATFGGPGYVIICGHEHVEAAYAKRDGAAEDVLQRLDKSTIKLGAHAVEEKQLPVREDESYLVRLGLAGPQGYYGLFGLSKCHFGVLSMEKDKTLYLLNFRKE
jgi:predicted phosphodiesterase